MTYEIVYSQGSYYQEADIFHRFFAVEGGVRIGELYIDIDRMIIMNIEVNRDRQREGIDTSLYETSVNMLGEVFHAPKEGCTPDGAAFAKAVGGPAVEYMGELHG